MNHLNLSAHIEAFALTEESRNNILKGDLQAPREFEDLARSFLSGCFVVKTSKGNIKVHPTCVEFYYHEEFEGGIKDPIVYHRNPKDPKKAKALFPLGSLHSHTSGIDITFEKGCSPQSAVRASVLIREFEVEGRNDDRSTALYEALFQQNSIFNGISVKWNDGENPVNMTSAPRKNVAEYDETTGEKKKSSAYPDCKQLTSDGIYVQDMRRWQFKIKKVSDADMNTVFLSPWLEKECPEFYNRFLSALKDEGVNVQLLKHTYDLWCRDYMPVQIYDNHFVQYRYYPNYLDNPDDRKYITNPDKPCKELGINSYKTNLIIDGGNVVRVGNYVIMTEKVYKENGNLTPEEVRRQLKAMFHCDLIMLPWDRAEKYGHADGIVKAIDDDTVLMTNYDDLDHKKAAEIEKRLKSKLQVVKLHYDVKEHSEDSWAYINFLRVGNKIFIPGLGTEEDSQALEQISMLYKDCKVRMIDAQDIIRKEGAFNCITWTAKI